MRRHSYHQKQQAILSFVIMIYMGVREDNCNCQYVLKQANVMMCRQQ